MVYPTAEYGAAVKKTEGALFVVDIVSMARALSIVSEKVAG